MFNKNCVNEPTSVIGSWIISEGKIILTWESSSIFPEWAPSKDTVVFSLLTYCFIIWLFLQEAAKMVQASTKRKGFSKIPSVKWEDVGGLDSLRKNFERSIIRPIKHPEYYEVLATSYCKRKLS